MTIGGTAVTAAVAGTGTSLTFTTPPGAAGAAAVLVQNPSGGTARRIGGFIYLDELAVDRLLPDRGSIEGNTLVRIEGRGFELDPLHVPVVRFGGTPATVTVLGPRVLEVITPNGPLGPVDVAVTSGVGTITLTTASPTTRPSLAPSLSAMRSATCWCSTSSSSSPPATTASS